jgi:2-polyprenyl-3-methyl-5-hydroxy-6-metoxy-1,4-benzoquinol methylase
MANEPLPSPQLFVDTLLAYQKTAAIKAALELGLFNAIGAETSSARTIAARTGAAPRGIRILCDYLTVLGFLEKTGEAYRQTPSTALFLDSGSPKSISSIARFLAGPEFLGLFLKDPASYVRDGGTRGLANMTPDDPIWVTFAETMTPFTIAAAEAAAAHVAAWPHPPCKVLDIAAGGGMFGITMARRFPGATIVAVDWADVVNVAAANAQRADLGSRYRPLAGDAFTVEWGGDYDLVLLPNILHHFDRSACVALLARVRASLAPAGRALVIEFIPNEDRVSPPLPAMFAFMMLGTTQHGDAFTAAEYTAMGRDAGFNTATLAPLPPSPESLIEFQV